MLRRQTARPNAFAAAWRKFFSSGNRSRTARPALRCRPQLEFLEDRIVPAVIDVNTLADVPLNQLAPGQVSLRDAIQIANTNGDATNVINLTVAGVYNISLAGTPGETDNRAGELSIFANANANTTGLNLTIQNVSGGGATINANNLSRVFDINANNVIPANNVKIGAVTIAGVTIENGLAQPGDGAAGSGGGIRDQGPVDLTLTNDVITNNNATADGGGISMENTVSTKWTLTLNNTTVSDNHAGDAGGGVEEDGTGKVFINAGTAITDNTCANQGAGIWLDAINAGTANLIVDGAFIADNTAGMLGGGIGNAGNGAVSISNSTIQGNTTTGFGGGFADQNNLGTLTVQNSLFLGNKAGTNGGGIQEGNGTTISNSEIKNNAAGVNGAMPIGTTGGGAPNAVMGSGGGLFIDGGALAISSSTIADNTASVNGGGIELTTTGATIINTTIVGNTALFNTPSNIFTNNGGGIDDLSGPLALVDDTITSNFAANGGGLFFPNLTGLTIQNTIIAGNIASAAGPDVDFVLAPTGVDLGGNLIGISGAGSGNTGFTAGNTQTGTVANPLNPQLTALANNGGPVAGSAGHQFVVETEALLPGSPAVGRGVANAATTDERGFPRNTPPSVGGFEFENVTLAVNVTPGTPTVVLNGTENFTVTVTNTSGHTLSADNSTVTVTLSSGMNANTTLTFNLGTLAPGQSASFPISITATAVGQQTVTATVRGVDLNPNTFTGSATINVTNPIPQPVGGLTPFAFGFNGRTLEFFDIDSRGDVFTQAFGMGGLGAPQYFNDHLQVPLAVFNRGMLLAEIVGANNQVFTIEVVNFMNMLVDEVLIAALHH